MYRKTHPLFFICNTPTHVGSGSDLGVIDLPIQRERHTGFPKFESSSIKGSIREAFEREINSKAFTQATDPDTMIHRLFGFDDGGLDKNQKDVLKKHFPADKEKNTENTTSFAGALGFTDARLLLFPVKSMKGVFAWVTCLRVLKQLVKDLQMCSPKIQFFDFNQPFLSDQETYLFSTKSNLVINGKVLLEEYTFSIDNELNGTIQMEQDGKKVDFPDWLAQYLFNDDGSYWSEKIKKDIIILPDDDFKDFVNLSTEVITRTKIDNQTGTVAQGQLFNEEYLPSESVLYSLALIAPEFRKENPLSADQAYEFFTKHLPNPIQIGANAGLGKGILSTKLLNLPL
jgi:CRISPR-associated protein Cmr4